MHVPVFAGITVNILWPVALHQHSHRDMYPYACTRASANALCTVAQTNLYISACGLRVTFNFGRGFGLMHGCVLLHPHWRSPDALRCCHFFSLHQCGNICGGQHTHASCFKTHELLLVQDLLTIYIYTSLSPAMLMHEYRHKCMQCIHMANAALPTDLCSCACTDIHSTSNAHLTTFMHTFVRKKKYIFTHTHHIAHARIYLYMRRKIVDTQVPHVY